jgi:glycosyltransferase involved in cell wall biosynthesis
MRALFVVNGRLEAPDARARVHALLPALAALGVESRVLEPGPARKWRLLREARRADVVVLQRVLPPRPLLALLARTAPLVFDVDDALGTHPELQARLSAMTAVAEVVAGNAEIARTLPGAPRVAVVPTVVDPAAYGAPRPHDGPLRVGWIGTPENLPFLELVRPALAALVRGGVPLELRVISSAAPAWEDVPVVHVPWTLAGAADALRDLDVGLAPLPDTPWARSKCGYKALEYMASSLPVVASPVGALASIVVPEETGLLADGAAWESAIRRLASDPELRAALSAAGRRRVEERYSVGVAAAALAAVLERVSASKSRT